MTRLLRDFGTRTFRPVIGLPEARKKLIKIRMHDMIITQYSSIAPHPHAWVYTVQTRGRAPDGIIDPNNTHRLNKLIGEDPHRDQQNLPTPVLYIIQTKVAMYGTAVVILINNKVCCRAHHKGVDTGSALGAKPPDFESYFCLCSRMVSTSGVEQAGSAWLIVWKGCCTTSVGSPAGRLLSRSGEGEFSIATGRFAVSSHDTSYMLTTSGVTELLVH